MTIKRMVVLLSAAAALVAFAVPAVAQAKSGWNSHETGVLGGPEESHAVEGTGSLSSTRGPLTSGPCQVHLKGNLWNSATMGEGSITSFTITATHVDPCPTSGPGIPETCKLATAEANNLPWSITLNTGGAVEVLGASFTNRYTGCGSIGIPDGVGITAPPGTVTGKAQGQEIAFVNAGHLKIGEVPVQINGSVSIPGITAE